MWEKIIGKPDCREVALETRTKSSVGFQRSKVGFPLARIHWKHPTTSEHVYFCFSINSMMYITII